jgi:hypothetical protein
VDQQTNEDSALEQVKEQTETAIEEAKAKIEPKVEEIKGEVETAAASNPWPLLAGAFVLGFAVAWLLF